MYFVVDTADGGPFDVIGDMINKLGVEDSSGLRRAVLSALAKPDYAACKRLLPNITDAEVDEMRSNFDVVE